MIYFWREKNADSCDGRATRIPTSQELGEELAKKLEQKLAKLDVVFDKSARENFYLADKKPKKSLAGMTEQGIVSMLGKRLAVDFLQLSFDLCDYFNIEKQITEQSKKMMIDEIKQEISSTIDGVRADCEDVNSKIGSLQKCAKQIASLSNVAWDEVVALQKEIEEKEGSFFKGKFVYFDEE